MMKIDSPESYRAFQIDVAQGWRDKHNLPKIPDDVAVRSHYMMPDKPQVNRRRMNTSEHITRLLRVWELWKQQPRRKK